MCGQVSSGTISSAPTSDHLDWTQTSVLSFYSRYFQNFLPMSKHLFGAEFGFSRTGSHLFMEGLYLTILTSLSFIREPEDNYGTWKNNTWSGMIGMLYRNEVDLILNPIIPKASILEFAHFTNPIIIDAYTILSGKKIQEPGLFLYFKVLDTTVWIAMVATAIVLGFTSTTIYKRVLMPKDFSWIRMIRQYSWHFLSYALRQNPTEKYLLRSNKTRLQAFLPLIATLWILGIGLIMSSFQSLLVSKLTIRESQPFVDSMDEFVNTDSTIGIAPVEIQLGDVLEVGIFCIDS
ncbi:lig_chan-Glu_bd domain-containing protein [Trichonephila clavata]|uniref:Lig_chan-Glu_bd domain-containing protein n=1 Tax=Trichonephila clavata TaxID=2740835 RepID=A0A8X6HIB1_TRICU|nr:lig_chan-Glu_bd domain-containing protein [Trichonephila clavata]